MLADALGRPLRFILTGGQVHDVVTAPALLAGVKGGGVIADKAYDSNSLRQLIADAGMLAIIPSNRSRKVLIPHDADLYKPATASNAVSTSSSTSGASPLASTAELSTSSHLSISQVL
jgi:IS5 family transposase